MKQLGMNPFFTMWASPNKTIRAIIDYNPNLGFYFLSAITALQSFFFIFTYYELRFPIHYLLTLAIAIVLSPFVGAIWLYFLSWVLHFTGKWMKGRAPFSHVKAALAWSRLPLIIDLLMWFILSAFVSGYVALQYTSPTSILFINLISSITAIWAFVLLVQALREVQGFTMIRSVVNVILMYVILFVVMSTISYLISRVVYI